MKKYKGVTDDKIRKNINDEIGRISGQVKISDNRMFQFGPNLNFDRK